jgi:hypothetical protein
MDRYRVFISYSHTDRDIVEKLAGMLERNGLTPIWDKDLRIGTFFDDEIKNYIAHAHVFMPIITAASSKRGWVHQEIGYAMAMNIPMLPVSIEKIPGEMLQRLHAVMLDKALGGAEEILTYSAFDKLVKECGPFQSVYHYTEMNDERAEKIAAMANYVKGLEKAGCVRQKGGCSSFQIPNRILSDPVWDQRYYPNGKVDTHCKMQLSERKALEIHAREAGCKLIVNPALILDKRYHTVSRIARLGTFLSFLTGMEDGQIDVAFDDRLTFNETLTIVGDWFSTESYYRSEAQGFKHSLFTRHAPAIKSKIEAFDEEFDALLRANGTAPGASRKAAVKRIEDLLNGLK